MGGDFEVGDSPIDISPKRPVEVSKAEVGAPREIDAVAWTVARISMKDGTVGDTNAAE
jgi:hypothetical protein